MANDLVLVEQQLTTLAPQFEQVLSASRMPVERLIRTVVVSCERLPALLNCDRQTIMQGAMTFAVLGLEVDGVTGQGYLLPFKGKAQPVIGYKGYNTLGWRAGLTIDGQVVYEGDEFEPKFGTNPSIHHVPGKRQAGARILGAWAAATAPGRTPIISWLSLDDIMAIKAKSPGGNRSDSPWSDPLVGFPAMGLKSAKRRLARSTPLSVMNVAAAMEEAHEERGMRSYISQNREVVLDAEIAADSPNLPAPGTYQIAYADGSTKHCQSVEEVVGVFRFALPRIRTAERLKGFYERNLAVVLAVREVEPEAGSQIAEMYHERTEQLSKETA